MEDLEFRALRPSDTAELRKLCTEVFPIEYPEQWYEYVTSGKFDTTCAVHNDTIVAIIIGECKYKDEMQKEDESILDRDFDSTVQVGYILSLGVSSVYRSKGLGSHLLSALIERFRSKRCLAVYLHVLSTNFDARQFYEARSFTLHAIMPYYYNINGNSADGLSYVFYMNGGHNQWNIIFKLVNNIFTYLLNILTTLSLLCSRYICRRFVRRNLLPHYHI